MTLTKDLPNNPFLDQICALLHEGHTATIRVRGVSMRPFLEGERDCVVLEAPKQKPKVGDVVLAFVDNQRYVIHRIIRIENNTVTLMGDGNICIQEVCTLNDIAARAIAFIRKGNRRTDLSTSRRWKCYSGVWMHTLGIRRWLLAFHRHVWLKLFPVKIYT